MHPLNLRTQFLHHWKWHWEGGEIWKVSTITRSMVMICSIKSRLLLLERMLPQCRPTIKYYRRNNINAKRRFSIYATPKNLLDTTRLLHVFLTRRLVFVYEVRDRILAEPVGNLWKLLAEAVDGLQVHIRLCDQLWKGDCLTWAMIGKWGLYQLPKRRHKCSAP